MAASTSVMNSTDVVIGISTDSGVTYSSIARATSASLSLNMDVRETTNKDSAGWRELLEGLKSWSLSADGLVCFNTSGKLTISDLFGHLNSRTLITVKFGSAGTGEKVYSGTAFVTAISQDGGFEDNVTYSVSFEGSGVLTEAANA